MTFHLAACALNPVDDPLLEIPGVLAELKHQGLATPNLITYPECALTGFSPLRAKELSNESHTAEFERVFSSISSALDAAVLAGAFLETDGSIFNSAVLFDGGVKAGASTTYSKRNLFAMSDESEVVTAGSSNRMFKISGWNISPKICYDLRFPNDFYTQAPDVDLFNVIANWPHVRSHAWHSLLRARAIENEAFVLGVNRSGEDEFGNEYNSKPVLFDPLGIEVEPTLELGNMSFWELPHRSTFNTVGSTRARKHG